MKISDVTKKNIKAIMLSNQFDGWAAKVAKQYPNLILDVLEFCRPGERPGVWDVTPIEMIETVIRKQPDSSYTFARRFPNIIVDIFKILTETINDNAALKSTFRFLLQEISENSAFDVIIAFPEKIDWVLEVKPGLRGRAEVRFKLED